MTEQRQIQAADFYDGVINYCNTTGLYQHETTRVQQRVEQSIWLHNVKEFGHNLWLKVNRLLLVVDVMTHCKIKYCEVFKKVEMRICN